MSVIKGKKLQLGYDGTASNNFTLYQPGTPDGTLRLANGIAGAETDLITLTSAGYMGIGKTNPNAPLTIGRMNSAEEGGEISLCRSSDNSSVWSIDAYGSTSTPSLRFVDNVAGAVRMNIDGSGRITKPAQPAFLAQAVQTDTAYSGVGTLIPFPNEVFDIGNNYDASISRFTAPVTGIYLVSWSCWNSSGTTSRSALYKNGSIYKSSVNSDPISTRHNGGGDQANGVTIPVQMSVGDYIEIKVYGNAITQFWMNYFSAYLLG